MTRLFCFTQLSLSTRVEFKGSIVADCNIWQKTELLNKNNPNLQPDGFYRVSTFI